MLVSPGTVLACFFHNLRKMCCRILVELYFHLPLLALVRVVANSGKLHSGVKRSRELPSLPPFYLNEVLIRKKKKVFI